jgi:hypothetical protein
MLYSRDTPVKQVHLHCSSVVEILSDKKPSDTQRSRRIWIFILFYFILFYFILFYFILFYFILFYASGPPMPVPIPAINPNPTSKGMNWIALFDSVWAISGMGRL